MHPSFPTWEMIAARILVAITLGALFWNGGGQRDVQVEVEVDGIAVAPSKGPYPFSFLTSKTPYKHPESSIFYNHALNDQCELVHVNFVSRHGTRHVNKVKPAQDLLARLTAAGDAGELTPWGQKALQWLIEFVTSETDRQGMLAPQGRQELFAIGERFGKWANRTLQRVLPKGQRLVFGSTAKQRAEASRDAFMEGMLAVLDANLTVGAIHKQSSPTCAVPEFNLLRFFDTCKAYDEFANNEAEIEALVHDVLDDVGMPIEDRAGWERDVLQQLLIEGSPLLDDAAFVTKAVSTLYSVCQIQSGAHNEQSKLCSLFRTHYRLLAALELREDLSEYFEKGGGSGLAYGQSCVLLEDMFSSMDAIVSPVSEDPAVFGHFRFAHAETLTPLITLLDVFGNQPFPSYVDYENGGINAHSRSSKVWVGSGASVVPMATHIAMLLYKCEHDQWKVMVTHNEQVMRVPACTNEDMCPLDEFKSYYRSQVYPGLGFGGCAAADWMARCGGVTTCDAASPSSASNNTSAADSN